MEIIKLQKNSKRKTEIRKQERENGNSKAERKKNLANIQPFDQTSLMINYSYISGEQTEWRDSISVSEVE